MNTVEPTHTELPEVIDLARQELQVTCNRPCEDAGNGRTCHDLRTEVLDVVDLVPDALCDAQALCDILRNEPPTLDLREAAEHTAGALFLGRRLVDSNLERVTSRCDAGEFDQTRQIARALGTACEEVAAALQLRPFGEEEQ